MRTLKSRGYLEWKLALITCIVNDQEVDDATKREEIKCVLRDDGNHPSNYLGGSTPEDSWWGELQAIKDSADEYVGGQS